MQFLNLQVLDLSFGSFSSCLTSFLGLTSLTTLDLSGNYCDLIRDDIFDHLPSLRHLYLSSAHLGADTMRLRGHRILQYLTGIQVGECAIYLTFTVPWPTWS
jgi:hypothetical protein